VESGLIAKVGFNIIHWEYPVNWPKFPEFNRVLAFGEIVVQSDSGHRF